MSASGKHKSIGTSMGESMLAGQHINVESDQVYSSRNQNNLQLPGPRGLDFNSFTPVITT